MTVIDTRTPSGSSAPAGHEEHPGGPAPHRQGRWRRRPRSLVRLVLALAIAIVAILGGLLPQQLGGRMSYVITNGISMLPHIHAGELVILRREPNYHVGEVAAYHNQQL